MVDEKISDMTDGGSIQHTDYVPAVRAGTNVKVVVGTMAAQDTAEYLDAADTAALVNANPGVVNISSATTLDATTHNGMEIHLFPHTGSPSGYVITIPYSLPVNFRCSFFNHCNATEVQIKPATGSPNDTLNDAVNVSAKFMTIFSGAYLRKTATGKLYIAGAVDVS